MSPDQKPSALSQQERGAPARESSTALDTGPPETLNESSSSKPGETSEHSPQRRNTSTESKMQRSASPVASASTVKYTRTGRVSKATKGQPIHHCEDCGKVRRSHRLAFAPSYSTLDVKSRYVKIWPQPILEVADRTKSVCNPSHRLRTPHTTAMAC